MPHKKNNRKRKNRAAFRYDSNSVTVLDIHRNLLLSCQAKIQALQPDNNDVTTWVNHLQKPQFQYSIETMKTWVDEYKLYVDTYNALSVEYDLLDMNNIIVSADVKIYAFRSMRKWYLTYKPAFDTLNATYTSVLTELQNLYDAEIRLVSDSYLRRFGLPLDATNQHQLTTARLSFDCEMLTIASAAHSISLIMYDDMFAGIIDTLSKHSMNVDEIKETHERLKKDVQQQVDDAKLAKPASLLNISMFNKTITNSPGSQIGDTYNVQ